MNLQMEAGITGTQTITVTEEKTAQAMGSGTLPGICDTGNDCPDGEYGIQKCGG